MKTIQNQIVTFIAILTVYVGLVYAGFSIYDDHMRKDSMNKFYKIMNHDRFYHYESME